MTLLLVLHLVLGVGLMLVSARFGKSMAGKTLAWPAIVAPLATLIWLATKLGTVVGGDAVTESVTWLPALGTNLDLRLDGFSAIMLLLIAGIGVLIFWYTTSYFSAKAEGVGRLIGLLVLFAGSMVGLVLADNLLVLYGFWELTSVTSFLLIGNSHEKAGARAAALQAFLITGAGGLAMLAGFLILGAAAGTLRISEIIAEPPTGTTVSVALVLILMGAFSKSAQYPFQSWLPGAMVAPTPVSAYLHSATMVKAGVYLIARLSPTYADLLGWWRPVVITVGLITMIFGGLRALRQTDLKVLLAHSTVSQLGFLVATFGIGTPKAMVAGAVLLLAHGAFKAAGFMVVGILDHQYGTRDLRMLPRADRSWAAVNVTAVVAAASMAGIPLTLGFISKESVLDALTDQPVAWWLTPFVGMIVGSALTAAYSIRFAWGAMGFGATEPTDTRPADVRPRLRFVGPGMVLTALTLALGPAPFVLDELISAAESSLHQGGHGTHLALWHGFVLALGGSILALAEGTLLFYFRTRVENIIRIGRKIPTGTDVYQWILKGTVTTATRVTAITQPGSLPIYTGVILFTATMFPMALLVVDHGWPGLPPLVDSPAQIPIAVTIIIGAFLAAGSRRRFSAALCLGLTGYAMSALFVTQGAPDLALTQVAIETLATVLFVVVLRRLPARFGRASSRVDLPSERVSDMLNRRRMGRLALASFSASAIFVLAITMSAPETNNVASQQMIERALPEGGGRNVVNVTLVDFRGLDTMGEITVLASAAIGTVALARAGRRPEGVEAEPGAVRAVPPAIPLRHLVTLNVSVRVVFAVLVVTSLYFLFAGHNQPGGGFVGGIILGTAVALRYVAGGIREVRSLSRARPWTVLGSGLVLSIGTALVPVLFGRPVLTNGYVDGTLPVLGYIKLTSAVPFDLGVYLTVAGLALMMFESFGDDPAPSATAPPVSPATAEQARPTVGVS